MSLNAKNIKSNNTGNKVKQPVIEIGTYPARLVQLIDLGLQPQRAFEGKEKAPAHEVMWTYELVDVFMVDEEGNELEDKPRWISETLPFYGLDQEKAKSTQRVKALDPENACDGDLSTLVDTPVSVTLIHKPNKKDADSPYVNISGTSPMRARDAAKCPELKNPTKVFDLDTPDLETFNSIPDWIKEKIVSNLNFKGSALEKLLAGDAPKEDKPKKAPKKEAPPQEEDEEEDAPF